MIWPYYVSQGSSKGDLLIAFVFVQFFPRCFDPRGTRRGNGALQFSAVTVYQRRERWKAQQVVSHKPARSWTGLLDRSQGWHKELCHIPVLYWTAKIFILLESGNELS